jgi:hypothetical protein
MKVDLREGEGHLRDCFMSLLARPSRRCVRRTEIDVTCPCGGFSGVAAASSSLRLATSQSASIL